MRLIKEDQNLEGDVGTTEALQILRESSAYGVAMFPEESGESAGVRPSRGSRGQRRQEEMGAGDRIVMERARKRRKELEEEDEHEQEEQGEEEHDQRRIESRGRRTRKGKAKEAIQEEDSGSDVVLVPQKPKPRPRPINKASSSGNALEDEVIVSQREAKISKRKTSNATLTDTGDVKSQRPKRPTAKKFPFDVDSAADSTDADSSSRPNPSPRYRSLSASKTGIQSVRVSPTSSPPLPLKKRPQTMTRRGSSSEVNLYSTNESEGDRSNTSRTRRGRKIQKVESFMDIAVDSLEIKDDDDIYNGYYTKTPVAKRDRQRSIEITDDDTPKPARSPPSRVPPAVPAASESKPLEFARLRRQEKQAKDLARQ